MTSLRRGAPWRAALGLLVIGGVFASGIGITLGAGQIGTGPVENGQGTFVSEQGLAYWAWEATLLRAIPGVVPGPASTNPAVPTVLPAGSRSFTINTARAGDESVRWEFQEKTTAPLRTEIELRIVVGIAGTTASIHLYLETRALPLRGPINFFFYWDAGTFPPGALTIATMQATVLACSSIGTCP